MDNVQIQQPSLRQLQEYAQGEKRISAPDPDEVLPAGRKAEWVLNLIAEYSKRITDSLELYKPLPGVQAFHECATHKRMLRGSNRSGKTAGAGAEVARIVRGRDPYYLDKGLPKTDGRVLCVGADATHLAQVMWKKISWPGAFWCIPDEHTSILRAVRPHPDHPSRLDDYDEAQRPVFFGGKCKNSKWRPAPPFIPPNEIAEIAYEKKNLDQVKRVKLTSGWEMLWHTSEGNLRKGIDINVAWFDEDIKAPRWFAETFARLVDRDGHWLWSFTPEESTPEALHYHHIAETQPESIREFVIYIDDNPYLTQRAKKEFFNALSEDDRAVKYFGGYAADARKVYGTFDENIHGVKSFDIPKNWMRVAAHDPGTQRLGSLLCAVNPEATELHVYDEVFLKNSGAEQLAKKLAPKVKPYNWQAHILDYRAGRVTPFGMGKRVKEYYEEMFAKHWDVDFVDCHWGSDNVPAREESVRDLLRIDGQGEVKLKVHVERVPNFCAQMQAQFYKLNTPDKREKSVCELTDCMEYIAAFFSSGLFYEPPEILDEVDPDKLVLRLLRIKEKKKKLNTRREAALSVWDNSLDWIG